MRGAWVSIADGRWRECDRNVWEAEWEGKALLISFVPGGSILGSFRAVLCVSREN